MPPADGGIGWSSRNSAGEFSLVVQIREIWQADQLRYNPGPDPGHGVGPP